MKRSAGATWRPEDDGRRPASVQAVRRPDAGPSPPVSAGLLEDKLRIPRPSFPVLHRPRVARLLGEAAQRRVALVCAPPGAGKTVACAAWALGERRRVVWLTLDAADQRDEFWAYLCAGLRRARVLPPGELRELEGRPPGDFPLALVKSAQSLAHPIVIALDDLHEVSDPDVLGGVDVLIRHAPPALRLLLSTRRPPPLQLARLRIAGEVADVRGADLACTPGETDAYFRMLGIHLDLPEREEVLRRTEGWLAGLRLAALRAQSAPDPGSGAQSASGPRRGAGSGPPSGAGPVAVPGAPAGGLTGDEPMVSDYLWDEVLAGQPPEARSVLLRTSVVPELPGDLAGVLAGDPDGPRILAQMSRDNNFVHTLRAGQGGFRYHPLLREALAAGLARENPREIPALLRRAAAWHAARGRALDAVRCAARAPDWGCAAQALAGLGIGALLADPQELAEVLSLFPPGWETDDAAVAATWAAARLAGRDAEGARVCLENAARALPRSPAGARRIAEPTLAALRILHAADLDGADGGLAAAGWALARRLQPQAASQTEHRAVGALWFALGMWSLRRWDVAAAGLALRLADMQLGAGGLADLRARARSWRALAQALCGDLVSAQRAVDGARRVGARERDTWCVLALAHAQISLARDDLALAHQTLREAETCPAQRLPGEPPVAVIAGLLRAQAWLAGADEAAARATLSRLRGAWPSGQAPLSEAITVGEALAALRAQDAGRARALLLLADAHAAPGRADVRLAWAELRLAEGDFPAALEAVEPYLEGGGRDAPGGAPQTTAEQIRALLAAAVARRRLGRPQEAADLLERALEQAEPEGAYRVFLDAGAAVRSALTVLVRPTSRSAGFAGRVLERFDAQGARVAGPAERDAVRLTESERAVLCFLPSHMTNDEISQALYLSVNTVKTHLRSAYRKLGVRSRRQAIAQARRLGLI